MIDITQIVNSAANAAAQASRPASPNADAAFGNALERAREAAGKTDKGNTAEPAKAADQAGKAATADKPEGAEQASGADSNTPRADQGARPDDKAVAGKPEGGAGNDDAETEQAAIDPNASAAAAALAALLGVPVQTPAPATTIPAGTAGTNTPLPGAAVDANAALPAATLPATTTAANTATDGDAATGSTFATDTLNTIASQRAAMAGTATQTDAAPDAPATAASSAPQSTDLAAALKSAMSANADGQGSAGQSGTGQQQAGLAQRQDTPQAASDTSRAAPAAPFLPAAQAATDVATPDTVAVEGAAPAAAATDIAATNLGTAPAATGTLSRAPSLPIASPVGDREWPQALSQQMVRLSTQGNHTAELQLNPPDLGPLKVVLNVVNDQAQASFVSPHASVRAAVEAALPQLRSAMADSGIQLGQTSVGGEQYAGQPGNGQQQQQPQSSDRGQGFAQFGLESPQAAAAARTTPEPRRLARGEVDTFA
jgi:flagellar hook-length control protein FliK